MTAVDGLTTPVSGNGGSVSSVPVRAILFTCFDDVEGYSVSASDPPSVMEDQFKDIGYHFLPDRGVCWRLITMALGDYKMVGVPVHIEDSKYARNAFVFCFCLIVENRADAVGIAKVTAQEFADMFHHLELESNFLSDPSNREAIAELLRLVREQLNSPQSTHVNQCILGNQYLQFLKPSTGVVPSKKHARRDASSVSAFFTPIPLVDLSEIELPVALNSQSLIDLLDACDGQTTVGEIVGRFGTNLRELADVLVTMESEGFILLADQPIDQFTRVRLTNDFHSFFDDLNNRQEAVSFCFNALQSTRSSEASSSVGTPRSISDISHVASQQQPVSNIGDHLVRMYCRLDGHTQDLGEFASVNQTANISARHMVILGLIRNFLRCKTMFPVYPEFSTTMVPVLRSCDGKLSWDEIGVKHGLNRTELNDVFTTHSVLRIWR